jgi:ubiquinone/menaquinone biosynthesis C-methylase UbiE
MTYYDDMSEGYEELHKEEQQKKISTIKENMWIRDTDLLLDIGCGPYFGDFGCRVVGIDPSIMLLKKAHIPVVQGYAERLPFRDLAFDIVVSVTAMQNFSDPEAAAREMKRVCRGRFALSFLKRSDKRRFLENVIGRNFSVEKRIVQEKDVIFIAKYKNQ